MIKRTYALLLLSLLSATARAQTGAEWLRQKETQRRYLAQQIAKLNIYLGYIKKGYTIAAEGLSLIGDIKNGDFLQHNDYFSRLHIVSPAIRQHPRVKDIIALYNKIQTTYRQFAPHLTANGILGEQERVYCLQTSTALLNDVALQMEALKKLLTNNQLEMTDDQRLARIENIHHSVVAQYDMLRSFCERTTVMARQRQQQLQQLQSIKQLFRP